LELRKPHLVHSTFWERNRKGKSTRFAKDLLRVVRQLEHIATQSDPLYLSPVEKQQKLSKWATYAVSRLQLSKGRNSACRLLEHWYEALRIVVMTWEERDGHEMAVMFLRMMECHDPGAYIGLGTAALPRSNNNATSSPSLATAVASFFDAHDVFPRFDHLKGILEEKKESFRLEFRGIIFVQQKTTAHVLSCFINADAGLRQLGFRAVALHSVTTDPPTPSLRLTASEAKENLEAFASGARGVNLLVTTVVAEEGMDIPAANCVIRFDPVLNGVSFVQGRGRARQADSSFVIMSQRLDRPAAMLAEVEQMQQRLVASFDPARASAAAAEDLRTEKGAQTSRERGASAILKASADGRYREASNRGRWLADLNLFCKKTKVVLKERAKLTSNWSCALEYISVTREVKGAGTGASKKEAQQAAAIAC
jgi:ERCC4-related helicase